MSLSFITNFHYTEFVVQKKYYTYSLNILEIKNTLVITVKDII